MLTLIPPLLLSRNPCLRKGASHNGLSLLVSINLRQFPTDMPTGQSYMDNPSWSLSSQVSLGCVNLAIHTNHHKRKTLVFGCFISPRQGGTWIHRLMQIVNDHSATCLQGLGRKVCKVSSDWESPAGCPTCDFSPSEPLPHPCQIGSSYLYFVTDEHPQDT